MVALSFYVCTLPAALTEYCWLRAVAEALHGRATSFRPLELPPDGKGDRTLLNNSCTAAAKQADLALCLVCHMCKPADTTQTCRVTRAVAEKVRAHAAAAALMRPSAAAVGPQRAPSPPFSKPAPEYAAAPSPAAGNRTFVSAGDWIGRATHAAVQCSNPPNGPTPVGRCTNVCDQLYNTCPLPTDLPRGPVPPLGGPVGSSPTKKLPVPLTPAQVTAGVQAGRLRRPTTAQREADFAMAINVTTTNASPAAHRAEPSPAHINNASSATVEAFSINIGDSWAIRNTNCEIAPIHGILNRVCTEP